MFELDLNEYNCIINAVLFSVVIYYLLSHVASKSLTDDEKQTTDLSSLSFFSQIKYKLAVGQKTPLSSCVFVGLLVAVSIWLGYYFKPYQELREFFD